MDIVLLIKPSKLLQKSAEPSYTKIAGKCNKEFAPKLGHSIEFPAWTAASLAT